MSLQDLLRALRKHLLKVVLLVLVGIGAAYGFSKEQHPVYASTVSLVINPASPNVAIPYVGATVQGSGAGLSTLAGTYSEYLKSEAFAKLVISKNGLSVPPVAISDSISSALVAGTNFFHITVQWSSPQGSAQLANSIAAIFIGQNQTVLQQQQRAGPAESAAQRQLTAQAQFYKAQVDRIQQEVLAVQKDGKLTATQKNAQVTSLEQQLVPFQDSYTKILAALQASAATSTNGSLNTAQVIDPAGPGKKITPSTPRNVLFGAVSGLAVGLGVVAAFEYLDTTVHTPQELEELVGAPVLALIGVIGGRREQESKRNGKSASLPPGNGNGGGKEQIDPKLVTVMQPLGKAAESFRVLRTMLEFSNVDNPPRTLVITSAGPGEGKTLISANLAVALAQSGKRVILVDADLHRPGIHSELHLSNQVGLTNLIASDPALVRDQGIRSFVHEVPSVPGLVVLTSGPLPPNPSELLGSARAATVFGRLAEMADVVIYDTPPANVLTDAFVLATRVAGVIVIARANQSHRSSVQHTSGRMRQVGAVVIGAVLNMVPETQSQGGYYYQSGYYYKSSQQTDAALPVSR
ncbi:MAG: polysaccharide biosynthesis tyrosine autokinase [Chloroflexi bacterium]|nr:polysaccharide biosynthesis tyrosine autokinase [Chloroflexota bacterium]